MDREPQVTLAPESWSPEVLTLLERVERFDTSGGMERVTDYQGLPVVCARDDAGELVGAYVPYWDPERRNLYIVAAAGAARGVDLTATMLADIEHRAKRLGADWVGMQTIRPGLVRRLTRAGYGVHGTILRKLMKAAQ